jgi:diaminobutyrate-2-oxoglutarate transaminase
VQQECLRRGLIVELGGRHASVVRLLPPLTITDEQTAAVLDRLADAVEAVARGPAGGGPTGRSRGGRSRGGRSRGGRSPDEPSPDERSPAGLGRVEGGGVDGGHVGGVRSVRPGRH